MQIKVEIDVKPEELRRFLGLPDVAGLQEDLMGFLRDKMGQASDGLSPAADFVRDNFENLKSSAAVQRLLSTVKVRISEPEPVPVPLLKKRKTRAAAGGKAAGKSAKKKPAA